MKTKLIFLIVAFATLNCAAQPGTLDNTFSSDGKVTTAVGGSDDLGFSIAIQSDGKILVSGYSSNGSENDFALVRYNSDGTLDNTFSSDGKDTTDFGSSDDNGNSVAIQSDGKILVAGSSDDGSIVSFALARYNSDGSLDNTFDIDGKVITGFGVFSAELYFVKLQNNGKILVAGNIWNGSDYDFALARYNSDGSLDNTFDTDGKVITDFGSTNDIAFSVDIQSDGKIIVAGYSGTGNDNDCAVVRYNNDGSLDNTFDSDGKVITDFGGADDYSYSVIIQSDGKIVVAGESYSGTDGVFALVRYNGNGSLDNTFDTDGKVTTDFGSAEDWATSIAIQSDDKIVVSGSSDDGTNAVFALVRYNSDGSLDNTFDADGKVTTDFGSAEDFSASIAIQSDGKIVVAGMSNNGSDYDFAVARYNISATGLEDASTQLFMTSIYPNPSSGKFILSSNITEGEIFVYNMLGEKIYSEKIITASQVINPDIQNGIYFLVIRTEQGIATEKIIIE